MIEAGVLIATDDTVIHWHCPHGRSGGLLPDSRDLWDIIWESRDRILGFAHSHPGDGIPIPSHTDITTFNAIEMALGRRLTWWITSHTQIVRLEFVETSTMHTGYDRYVMDIDPPWLHELRRLSEYDR